MTAANDGNMVFVEFTSGALASSDGHYAFTYVSANTFDITVATTNGASGNCTIDTTATTRTLWSLTVPGGLLGAMGMIEIDLFTQEPSNVNNKSLSVQFDGNVIFLTTNGATASQGRRVNAAFSTSGTDQSVYAHNGNNNHGWFYNGSGGLAGRTYAIDTSINKTLSIIGQVSVTNDYLELSRAVVILHKVAA